MQFSRRLLVFTIISIAHEGTIKHIVLWFSGGWLYLDKGEFTQAGAALGVPDGDLAVVLDPAPATQDVVYAGGDLVPLVVVPEPGGGAGCR